LHICKYSKTKKPQKRKKTEQQRHVSLECLDPEDNAKLEFDNIFFLTPSRVVNTDLAAARDEYMIRDFSAIYPRFSHEKDFMHESPMLNSAKESGAADPSFMLLTDVYVEKDTDFVMVSPMINRKSPVTLIVSTPSKHCHRFAGLLEPEEGSSWTAETKYDTFYSNQGICVS
jgi:hypothetical protein